MLSREISYTEVRAKLAETLSDVGHNKSIVVIRRRNQPDVALISKDELASYMETAHLFSSVAHARRLLEAME